MSIVAYSGLTGAGKTYGIVENVILPAFRAGRPVCTNIPLFREQLDQEFPQGYNLQTLENDTYAGNLDAFSALPAGAVIIVDEAWKFWKAGTQAKQFSESAMSFFTEHRHRVADGYSQEIILCTQDLAQIAKPVRALIEETYRAVKLSRLGASKSYRIDIYTGAVEGQTPPKARLLRQIFGKYKPEVYRFYKSHTLGDGPGAEVKVDDRANLFKSPAFRYGAPLALFAFILGVKGVLGYFEPETSEQVQPVTASVATSTAQPVKPRMPKNIYSPDWRFAGTIMVDRKTYAIIDGVRGSRLILGTYCRKLMLEYICEFEGQIISRYTGPDPQDKGGSMLQTVMPATVDYNESQ